MKETKTCNSCRQEIPITDFYLVQKRGKKSVFHLCKPCCAVQKQQYKAYGRDWELKKKYGITLEEYQRQSAVRDNQCDICKKQVKALHVDHCHSSGKVRGYLCGSCNRGLGLFQDSSKNLWKAYQYLQDFNEYQTSLST